MKNTVYLFLLMTVLTLFACNNEQSQVQAEIEAAEKLIDEDPTTENAEALIKKYEDYISKNPEDAATNARYLYRSAALYYRMNRFNGATSALFKLINNYNESETTPMAVMFLGDIQLEKLNNQEIAYSTYQSLIEAFPDSEETKKAIEKLPEGINDFDARLAYMGENIYNDSLNRIEYRVANAFISSSEIHAVLMPEAEDSPDKLYKAAEVARSVRAFDKALGLYEIIHERYPDHEKSAQALFMQAFTLDSDMKQIDRAREKYEAFIAQYPEDDFVDDAQVLLENLGKDDEAIIEAITKGKSGSEEKAMPKENVELQ
jgi:TolA-binding protein